MNLMSVLESLLFVCGEDGLSLKDIVDILELNEEEAKKILNDIIKEFEQEKHGLILEHYGDKYKFVTKKNNKEYLQRLVEKEENEFLSQSALETLAIIA